MRSLKFRLILTFLYLAGFSVLIAVAYKGFSYYSLPLDQRPRTELHALLKPGGPWGHSMGILGSSMLLLLFLYSARKRRLFGLRKGKLARWLDVHIWFGIMGPAFITLHSALKFHGIVSISYFSMMAVMISGFLGRYIYSQIPRDAAGIALPIQDIDDQIEQMERRLVEEYNVSQETLAAIDTEVGRLEGEGSRGVGSILRMALSDSMRPVRSMLLLRLVRKKHPEIPVGVAKKIVRMAGRRSLLARRRAAFETINRIFHYWHVMHKPFAYVMILIMVIHITVVVAMGYTWIF